MAMELPDGLFKTMYEKQPRHLKDRGDYVSWRGHHENGKMVGKGYQACYAPMMKNLGEWDIICWTHDLKNKFGIWPNHLSEKDFCALIDLWKSVGFIPEDTWRGRRKGAGNVMIIPRKGKDRHTVYAALCLYRYSDALPRTMRAALRIHEETGLPWLQVYHYVMASIKKGAGHGFLGFDNSVSDGVAMGQGVNPGLSMALCKFGAQTPMERHKNDAQHPGYVSKFMAQWITKLNPVKRQQLKWGVQDVPAHSYPSVEAILNPAYSPLFTCPELSFEEMAGIMEGARKEE